MREQSTYKCNDLFRWKQLKTKYLDKNNYNLEKDQEHLIYPLETL